jgi:hypothetical protein
MVMLILRPTCRPRFPPVKTKKQGPIAVGTQKHTNLGHLVLMCPLHCSTHDKHCIIPEGDVLHNLPRGGATDAERACGAEADAYDR